LRKRYLHDEFCKDNLRVAHGFTGGAKNFTRQECLNIIRRYETQEIQSCQPQQPLTNFVAEGEARAIITFLQVRFGKVPKSTSDAVHAVTAPKPLEKLTKLVAKSESLDDFNKALK